MNEEISMRVFHQELFPGKPGKRMRDTAREGGQARVQYQKSTIGDNGLTPQKESTEDSARHTPTFSKQEQGDWGIYTPHSQSLIG